MTVEIFIATSLDGFIARKNGALDWLENSAYAIEGEDFGFAHFIDKAGCLVMGTGTFEVVSGFETWPYTKPVYVLSNHLTEIPDRLVGKAFLRTGSLKETLNYAQASHEGLVYLDGGKMIQSALREGLLDCMTITRIPVLLGEGIPLFGPLHHDTGLIHKNTQTFENGFIISTYDIQR